MLLHRAVADAKVRGDVLAFHFFNAMEQENLPCPVRQMFEPSAYTLQAFSRNDHFILRGRAGLGVKLLIVKRCRFQKALVSIMVTPGIYGGLNQKRGWVLDCIGRLVAVKT